VRIQAAPQPKAVIAATTPATPNIPATPIAKTEAPPPELPKTEPAPTAAAAAAPAIPVTWAYAAQLSLRQISFSQEKEFTVALNGFTDVALGAEATRTKGDITWQTKLEYEKFTWEVENKKTWPYQKPYSSDHLFLNVFRYNKDSDWRWGVSAYNLTLLKRFDLEALEYETKYLFGPSIGYSVPVNKEILFQTFGGLSFGNGITALQSKNTLDYKMQIKNWPVSVGGDFDFMIFFGKESLSGYQLNTGLHIKYAW
jgi:hypothetical protein